MSAVRGRRKARIPKVLESIKETEKEQTVRKSLSTLQPAADNLSALVPGGCGTPISQKIQKLKPSISSKENSPMKPRRSKRKAAAASEELKVKSSTPVSNDVENTENAGLKQQTLTKYSKKLTGKLKTDNNTQEDQKNISEHPEASISIRSESSGYCSDGMEKAQSGPNSEASVGNEIAVAAADEVNSAKKVCIAAAEELQKPPSISQELCDYLINDIVPESYWKDLAEQRRLALEEALHENELLHDQIEVLEAENSRLMSLVKDAEALAEAVKDILE